MGYYRVKRGDTLSSIAFEFGFNSYKAIYDHPSNADFRTTRPDPDLIHPNDLIFIPDRIPKYVPKPSDAKHVFKVHRSTKLIRLAVQDSDGEPFKAAPYVLWVEQEKYSGETDDHGGLEQTVPVQAKEARLEIADFKWSFQIGDLNPIDNTSDDGASGIQMRLRNLGFHPGPIDGVIGPATTAAIREFQAKHPPLVVDGICGPKTRARLIQEHGC